MAPQRDDEKAVEVYLAHRAAPHKSARQLAAEFGTTHATVKRWIELGRDAEEWQVVFDRSALITTIHGALASMLHSSIEDAAAARDWREKIEHHKLALGVIDRFTRLHGLAAPTRVQVEDTTPRPPDPEFAERIRRARLAGDRELARDLDPNDDGKRY